MTLIGRAITPSNLLSSSLPLGPRQRWYVVRTHAQRELQASKQLENQKFRVFLPRHLKNRRHARRVETVSAPLFPQYLFAVVDLTKDRWRCINGTLGVDRVLMCAGEPQPSCRRRWHNMLRLSAARRPNYQGRGWPVC